MQTRNLRYITFYRQQMHTDGTEKIAKYGFLLKINIRKQERKIVP